LTAIPRILQHDLSAIFIALLSALLPLVLLVVVLVHILIFLAWLLAFLTTHLASLLTVLLTLLTLLARLIAGRLDFVFASFVLSHGFAPGWATPSIAKGETPINSTGFV
jgi:hypothetical protein